MYKFWYNVFKAKYGDKIRLLMTDTDSFIFQLYCDTLETELRKMGDWFDFSNYDKNNQLHFTINKKILVA